LPVNTLSPEELQTAAKTLDDSYPSDLDNSFVDELCHTAMFADIFKDDEPGDISTELFLYKLIIDKGMRNTFANVAIALRMYLVLMVTNCSAERSFSKLKLIESRLRTSMTQERLVNLAIMSIESDILREIDVAAIIINDFQGRSQYEARRGNCLVLFSSRQIFAHLFHDKANVNFN